MGVPLADRTVGPLGTEVGLQRCGASVVVTKVPVAPESRMAVSGGATTVKVSVETSFLEVLTTGTTAAPPRQMEEGLIQKQLWMLPPFMSVKVAVGW